MAESFKYKRVEFKKGEQNKFIIKSKKELDLTWRKFGELVDKSPRNLIDWKNEKNLMSLGAVKIICKKLGCKTPKHVVIKNQYWYVKKGALAGGKATYKKYHHIGGDEKTRKDRWYAWWEREGRLNPNKILKSLPFKKPKYSKDLAEFVGIILGDGGISDRQVTVTLHRITDKEYSKFVRDLIKKLFGIKAGEYCSKNGLADNIVISRTELVNFLEKIGLVRGNKIKHQVDIPQWIKKNKNFQIACVRGLMDTDGCVVIHKYKSKNKKYCYKENHNYI